MPNSATEPTIYVVDDDEAIRRALSMLLRSAGLKAELYASAEDFLARAPSQAHGCLLLDIRMPGMDGLQLQRMLNERQIHLPVILITGHGDVAMAVQAMKAGATDFIEKPFDNEALLDRIRQSLQQGRAQREHEEQRADAQQRLETLSRRERQVLDLLVEGKLNKQIAAELHISVRTVETHRASLMAKLQVQSVSDIVRLALLAR